MCLLFGTEQVVDGEFKQLLLETLRLNQTVKYDWKLKLCQEKLHICIKIWLFKFLWELNQSYDVCEPHPASIPLNFHTCTDIHTHNAAQHSFIVQLWTRTSAFDSRSRRQIKTLQKTHLALRYHYHLQKCIQWQPFSRGPLSPCNLRGRRGSQNKRMLSYPLVMPPLFSAHLPW